MSLWKVGAVMLTVRLWLGEKEVVGHMGPLKHGQEGRSVCPEAAAGTWLRIRARLASPWLTGGTPGTSQGHSPLVCQRRTCQGHLWVSLWSICCCSCPAGTSLLPLSKLPDCVPSSKLTTGGETMRPGPRHWGPSGGCHRATVGWGCGRAAITAWGIPTLGCRGQDLSMPWDPPPLAPRLFPFSPDVDLPGHPRGMALAAGEAGVYSLSSC